MSVNERRENPHLVEVVTPDPFNITYKIARALQPHDGPLWTDVSFPDVRVQTKLDNLEVEVLATFRGRGLIDKMLNMPDVKYLQAVVNPDSDPKEVLRLMSATQDPLALMSDETARKAFAFYLERVGKSNRLKGETLKRKYNHHLTITEEDGTVTQALPLTEEEFDRTLSIAAACARFVRQ